MYAMTIDLLAEKKHFKSEKVRHRFADMHEKLRLIALDAVNYAIKIGVTCPVFTETVSTKAEDEALNRVSSSHRECRAFDLRSIDWSGEQIDSMIEYLTKKYGKFGAIGKDGQRRVVVYHDSGHGAHFHVQLDKSFALSNLPVK